MLKILKVRNVKTPNRASQFESWIDFFVPEDLTEVQITPTLSQDFPVEDNIEKRKIVWNKIILNPGEGVLIPSWIKMIISEGYDLVFENKSWTSTKYHLVIWAKVVDNSYRWEAHLHLINSSNHIQTIDLWQKLAQWIIRKVENFQPIEISEEEFLENSNTTRGEGWFWSTWEK